MKITKEALLDEIANHHVACLCYAFSILRNWSASENVVRETYDAIEKDWKKYKTILSKSTSREQEIFLCTRKILHDKCSIYLSNEPQTWENVDPDSPFPYPIEHSIELINEQSSRTMRNDVIILKKHIRTLPATSQKLLYDFYVKGMSSEKIADANSLDADTLKARLNTLRNELKNCINTENSAESPLELTLDQESEELLNAVFTDNLKEEDIPDINQFLRMGDYSTIQVAAYVKEWSLFACALHGY